MGRSEAMAGDAWREVVGVVGPAEGCWTCPLEESEVDAVEGLSRACDAGDC